MKLVLRTIMAALLMASAAMATTYNRHEDVVRNTSGKTVSGASVFVYLADTDSLVTLYSNKSGSATKLNPTSTDAAGRYWFYAPAGTYDIAVSRYGIGRYTTEDVSIGLIVDGDVAFGGSVSIADSLTVQGIAGNLYVRGGLVANTYIISTEGIVTGGLISSNGGINSANGLIKIYSTNALVRGTGSPEGVTSGPPGALYERSDGSGETALYFKNAGSSTTGWKPLYLDKTTNQVFEGNITTQDTLKTLYIETASPGNAIQLLENTYVGGGLQVSGDLDVMGGDIELFGTKLITYGSGAPEGAVSAPVGCLYLRIDGGVGSTLYVKQSGTGNTGWAAK